MRRSRCSGPIMAPHPMGDKELEFDAAAFGIVGLETALALYIEALVAGNVIDWMRLIAMMTIEPARLCCLDSMGLGQLRVDGVADITVIDPGPVVDDLAAMPSRAARGTRRFSGARSRAELRRWLSRASSAWIGGGARCLSRNHN